jgi:prolyl-tRNA editing enzyme YbaK/EbsC (Cys-tRNA(Pro) deacylase)
VTAVHERIRARLRGEGVPFREAHHPSVRTSQEAADARNEPLAIGAKALLLKVDTTFGLFVLSAVRKLDSSAVKKHFGAKKLRFATAAELDEATGLVPGSVPPFGTPILPFPLHIDTSILDLDRVAFNAGSLTDSIVLARADYLRIAAPEATFTFSCEADP